MFPGRGLAEAEACQIAFREGFTILVPCTHNQSHSVASWCQADLETVTHSSLWLAGWFLSLSCNLRKEEGLGGYCRRRSKRELWNCSQMLQVVPVFLSLRTQGQEDHQEFQASLGYKGRDRKRQTHLSNSKPIGLYTGHEQRPFLTAGTTAHIPALVAQE